MRSVPNKNYNLQNVTTDSVYQNEQSINTSPSPVNLRAEALFDYTANKDDPNEISFNQGEIMEILDNNVIFFFFNLNNIFIYNFSIYNVYLFKLKMKY